MPLQLSDYFSVNRGGAPGTANSGTYYVTPISDLQVLIGGVSADPNNDLSTGTDGKPYFQETVTNLTYDAASTTLTYTNEDGVVQNVDLSALTNDIYVNGGTFNSATMVLTLTDNDPSTPDVIIPLGDLASTLVNDPSGDTFTHTSGDGTATAVNKTTWMAYPLAP